MSAASGVRLSLPPGPVGRTDCAYREAIKAMVAERMFERDERIDPVGGTWISAPDGDRTYWFALADAALGALDEAGFLRPMTA